MVWDPTHVQLLVIRSRGLLTKGKNGTNDAFVVMSMGKEKFQTSIKDRSGANVEWGEECELAIPDQGNTAEVTVTVYHRSMLGLDEFLGTVALPLKNYDVYERPKPKWYALEFKNDKKQGYRGEIELMLSFTVKSGSLTDLSKKEKHKGSLGQLSAKAQNLGGALGGSLANLGSQSKGGLKKFTSSVGHKIGKLPMRSTSMRGDKRAESGHFERRGSGRSIQSSSIGDIDEGAISEDDGEFRFDDLSHKSSNSSLNKPGQGFTPVQGSLENLAGGEFLSRNFSGPRSGTLPANLNLAGRLPDSIPPKPPRSAGESATSPDEWEKKLFGRNAKAAERSVNDVPVESSVPSIVVQQLPVLSPTAEEPDSETFQFTRRNASRRGRKKPEEAIEKKLEVDLKKSDEKSIKSAAVAPMPRNPEPERKPRVESPEKGTNPFEPQHEHVAKTDSVNAIVNFSTSESPQSSEDSFVAPTDWKTPVGPVPAPRNFFALPIAMEEVLTLTESPPLFEFETIHEDVNEQTEVQAEVRADERQYTENQEEVDEPKEMEKQSAEPAKADFADDVKPSRESPVHIDKPSEKNISNGANPPVLLSKDKLLDELPESVADDSGYQPSSVHTSAEVSPLRSDVSPLNQFFTPSVVYQADFFTPVSAFQPPSESPEENSPVLETVTDDGDFIDMPVVGLSPRASDSSFQFGAPDTAIVEDRSFSSSELAESPALSVEAPSSIRVHESHRRTLEGIEGLGAFEPTDSPDIFRLTADRMPESKKQLLVRRSFLDESTLSISPVESKDYMFHSEDEGTPILRNGRPAIANRIVEGIESPEKIRPKVPPSIEEELGNKSKEELLLMIHRMREHMQDKDEYISAVLLRCMEMCPPFVTYYKYEDIDGICYVL